MLVDAVFEKTTPNTTNPANSLGLRWSWLMSGKKSITRKTDSAVSVPAFEAQITQCHRIIKTC
jgi:hypothetical protein